MRIRSFKMVKLAIFFRIKIKIQRQEEPKSSLICYSLWWIRNIHIKVTNLQIFQDKSKNIDFIGVKLTFVKTLSVFQWYILSLRSNCNLSNVNIHPSFSLQYQIPTDSRILSVHHLKTSDIDPGIRGIILPVPGIFYNNHTLTRMDRDPSDHLGRVDICLSWPL